MLLCVHTIGYVKFTDSRLLSCDGGTVDYMDVKTNDERNTREI